MRKSILLAVSLAIYSFVGFAQHIDYNKEKGYGANGYDVVSYFSNKAVKGKTIYNYTFDHIDYKFSSEENLEKFKANPNKFVPQYGGWCAYAMAVNGEKVTINPKAFEIRNDKLYLFYNKLFTNTLESWLKEKPNELVIKADKNWEIVKNKS